MLVLVAALLHASAGALRNAAADRIAQPARQQLDVWRNPRTVGLELADWWRAYDALKRARAIAPKDPALALDLGLVLRHRAQQSRQVPALAEALLGEALEAFHDAARLRPVSPFAWANIAYVQHLRLNTGALTHAAQARVAAERGRTLALERALHYGPNEPAVRLIVERIGLY